jgi:hypothetical protein
MRYFFIFLFVSGFFNLLLAQNKPYTPKPAQEAMAGVEQMKPVEDDFLEKDTLLLVQEKLPETGKPILKRQVSVQKYTNNIQKNAPAKFKILKRAISQQKNAQDTILPKSKTTFWSKLGCNVKKPVELISIASTLFPLTKPPTESKFMMLLYVIYIIPLIFIITVLVIGGVIGFFLVSALLGGLGFLLYWGILDLLGIALTGGFLLGGIILAMVLGITLYFILSNLCRS